MKEKLTNGVVTVSSKVKGIPWVQRAWAFLFMLMVSLSTSQVAFATDAEKAEPTQKPVDFSGVTNPIVNLLNSLITPLMALVGAGGAIFCIFLGVKYATAEEPQEREKRKQSLKTAIIGFVLIFVLIVALRLSLPILTDWMTDSSK